MNTLPSYYNPNEIACMRQHVEKILDKIDYLEKQQNIQYPSNYYVPPSIRRQYAYNYYQQPLPPLEHPPIYYDQPSQVVQFTKYLSENVQPKYNAYYERDPIPEVQPIPVTQTPSIPNPEPAPVSMSVSIPAPQPAPKPDPEPVSKPAVETVSKPADETNYETEIESESEYEIKSEIESESTTESAHIFKQKDDQNTPSQQPTLTTPTQPLPRSVQQINSDSDVYPSDVLNNIFRNPLDDILEEEYERIKEQKNGIFLPRKTNIDDEISEDQKKHWTEFMKEPDNNYGITRAALKYTLMNYNVLQNVEVHRKRKRYGGGITFSFNLNNDKLMKAFEYDTLTEE